MRSLYLLIDGLALSGPFIASFSRRIRFYRELGPFLCASFSVGALFVAWDILFTHLGVWNFNPRYVTGVYFFNLPVEELLFFLCIPFACVFTFYCLDRFLFLERIPPVPNFTAGVIVALLAGEAVIFYERLYTSSALISASVACLVVQLLGKGRLLGKCIAVYGILMVPFFLVNGLLTGTGPQEPVVRYNDAENLGIRLLTIPVEDVFYGFSLISLNIVLFELFARRQSRHPPGGQPRPPTNPVRRPTPPPAPGSLRSPDTGQAPVHMQHLAADHNIFHGHLIV